MGNSGHTQTANPISLLLLLLKPISEQHALKKKIVITVHSWIFMFFYHLALADHTEIQPEEWQKKNKMSEQ